MSLIVLQQTNWVSTVGENINEVEKQASEIIGRKYGVGLSSGTAALHLAVRLAAEKIRDGSMARRSIIANTVNG